MTKNIINKLKLGWKKKKNIVLNCVECDWLLSLLGVDKNE